MDQSGRAVPQKQDPPVKVVGFHVEGASPSPRPNSLREALKTGSMSPVMIPPTFLQQQSSSNVAQISPRRASTQSPCSGPPTTLAAAATVVEEKQPQKEKRSSNNEQQQNRRPQQKEMTKAERRALQEAQRAAKAAAKTEKEPQPKLHKTASSSSLGGGGGGGIERKESSVTAAPQTPQPKLPPTNANKNKTVELFAHLPQHRVITVESISEKAATAGVPIECVRLGLQMADGSIRGANARCAAMLDVFAATIKSFKTAHGKVFAREFGAALNAMVNFLVGCRPLSPAMGNVIKAVKAELGRIGANPSITESDAKTALLNFVATFTQEKVIFAKEALARQAADRVTEGDVILTYARSSTVEAVLLAAAAAGTKFSVAVVDSRPLLEGRGLLTRLLEAGIPCEYMLINGMLPALSNVTKVMLGAGAVMSNGAVLARVGTAAVAMAATAAHVPVMVCSETYKFHDRVQLDSVTYNELGNPEALLLNVVAPSSLLSVESNPNLSLLNLEYDTTPAEYVTVVVTEVGVLPPTSVPVVLREYRIAFSSGGGGGEGGVDMLSSG